MKCAICSQNITETFLKKLIGTYVKHKGKVYTICKECQKKHPTKEEMVKEL